MVKYQYVSKDTIYTTQVPYQSASTVTKLSWYSVDGATYSKAYFPYDSITIKTMQPTSITDSNAALSSFDGKGDNDKYITWYSNRNGTTWKTSRYVKIGPLCCYRYHTIGTSQGDWYMPSVAELAYVPSIVASLTATATMLRRKFRNKTTIYGTWSQAEEYPASITLSNVSNNYTNYWVHNNGVIRSYTEWITAQHLHS